MAGQRYIPRQKTRNRLGAVRKSAPCYLWTEGEQQKWMRRASGWYHYPLMADDENARAQPLGTGKSNAAEARLASPTKAGTVAKRNPGERRNFI